VLALVGICLPTMFENFRTRFLPCTLVLLTISIKPIGS
jgi:hypothetical protein